MELFGSGRRGSGPRERPTVAMPDDVAVGARSHPERPGRPELALHRPHGASGVLAEPSHLPVLLHVTATNDRQIDRPGHAPAQF
jgi:hypothetical protein